MRSSRHSVAIAMPEASFPRSRKVYINTISPWDLRDRIVDSMYSLRERGKLASGIVIASLGLPKCWD